MKTAGIQIPKITMCCENSGQGTGMLPADCVVVNLDVIISGRWCG